MRYVLVVFVSRTSQDPADHARRCKRRGVDARKRGDLKEAIEHYRWVITSNLVSEQTLMKTADLICCMDTLSTDSSTVIPCNTSFMFPGWCMTTLAVRA